MIYMKFFLLLTVYLAVVNLWGFFLMVLDKSRAVHHRYRVSERALLMAAACGGALGVGAAMLLVHHKTQKPKFTVCVPFLLVGWAVLYIILWVKIRGGV